MGDDVVYSPSKERLHHIADSCNGSKAPSTLILDEKW